MADQPAHVTTVSKEDIEKNKVNGILCYLGILIIIPFVNEEAKKSPYVQFHLNQGLVLLIAGVALSVIGVVPILGWILAPIAGLVLFVIWLMGLISAAQGNMKRVPILGNIEILK